VKLAHAQRPAQIDEERSLTRAADWTPEMSEAVAREAGVGLGPDAWKVILFARDEFARSGQTPGLRRISAATGVPITDLCQIFTKAPSKLVARIAGIPES